MSKNAPYAPCARHSIHQSWIGFHLLLLLCLLLAAAAYPLLVEFDPWHGHAVIGGSNQTDKLLAILDHRHSSEVDHTHPWERDPDESSVLSFANHTAAMLASLLDSANPALVTPISVIPFLLLFLALPLGLSGLIQAPVLGLSPPSPPPRSFA